jgi:antitoxin CptB
VSGPGAGPVESPEVRLKRLRLRSVRRGIREMDLLLGRFARDLDRLTSADLDAYERLLDENDQDLLAWITGLAPPPPALAPLLRRIVAGDAAKFDSP